MRLKYRMISLWLGVCLLVMPFAALAVEKTNPLIFPSETIDYIAYPDTILNVLLLGIDLGREGYWGSAFKDTITDCHTDAVMVVAFNLTQNKIDIVSIPRDTVTIVPGVRGIYKLNSAVNCATTLARGLERTQASVEKLLGGIKISGYFAVDMGTMFKLGDALGGIDYEVDMSYGGDSGRRYTKGFQHLDGQGIMDYVRARKNATVDGTDLGRTRRQREMITAIMKKLMRDSASALNVLNALADPANGVFTNMTGVKATGFLSLAPLLLKSGGPEIHSYTMVGGYHPAMGWNFTFTDQNARIELIQAVYGVSVSPMPYVSREHTKFYEDVGFYSMHVINLCTELLAELKAENPPMTTEEKDLYQQLRAAYDETIDWFQQACDSLDHKDITKMKYARVAMRDLAIELTASLGYEEQRPWKSQPVIWYQNPHINEFQLDWR